MSITFFGALEQYSCAAVSTRNGCADEMDGVWLRGLLGGTNRWLSKADCGDGFRTRLGFEWPCRFPNFLAKGKSKFPGAGGNVKIVACGRYSDPAMCDLFAASPQFASNVQFAKVESDSARKYVLPTFNQYAESCMR